MIAKIALVLLLAILLPDIYLYLSLWPRRRHSRRGRTACLLRRLWWVPSMALVGMTVWFCTLDTFVPRSGAPLRVFLCLAAMFVVPKLLISLALLCRVGNKHPRRGSSPEEPAQSRKARRTILAAALIVIPIIYILLLLGTCFGATTDIQMRHFSHCSPDVPKGFEGYKIVQFSDLHLGTFLPKEGRKVVEDLVDKINNERADLVVFTGDLQNMVPSEIEPYMDLLRNIEAKDGVISIMGNHDYAQYSGLKGQEAEESIRRTQELERQLGWTLLLNESRTIHRGGDSIVIAGMENDGDGKHFPQLGDIDKTLGAAAPGAFVVMLQHDPSSWRRNILPDAHLTLSGHTHGGQFVVFGWSPVAWKYDEWAGLYTQDGKMLNVSTGVGGVVPYRFGVKPEICVVTLNQNP